jgi:fibronectin type 3 domain-containing protein
MAKNIKIKLILLMMVFLCCLLVGCNESSSSSDKTKSADVETTWYRDADGDGYGDPSATLAQQSQPDGYVAAAGDCADYDAEMYPGAPELCDGKDNNCDGTIDENACDPNIQTISGQIANVSQIQPYLRGDSYLQLVLYPADGQMVYTTDGQGRRIYPSNLAIIDMPADGAFSFEATELSSGDYVVAAQLMAAYSAGGEEEPIVSDSNGQPVVFTILADTIEPLDIDLGNVTLPVPAAVVDEETGPNTPTGVAASDGEFEDKIRVTWNPSPEADTYEVFRADSFAGQKTKVTTTAATVYEDRSLACGVDFYYWVKALNAFGESDLFYSDLGFIRCPAPVVTTKDVFVDGNENDSPEDSVEAEENKAVTLNTPSGVSASDGVYADKIRITWNAVSGAAAYDVYRCDSCCGDKIKIGSSSALVYDDFDVKHGNHFYWIKANDATGTSEFSLPDVGYIMIRPFEPTGVEASDGTYYSEVLITWDPALKPQPYNFDPCCPCCEVDSRKICVTSSWEIYRARWCGDTKILIGTSTTNRYIDRDLECSNCCCVESYVYSVKAVNAAGKSNFSNEDEGHVYETLCDPTGVKASDGRANCVLVSWNRVPGAERYDIYRSNSEDGPKTMICSVDHPCTLFRDTTTTCPTVYYYWVKTIDSKGYTDCRFGKYDTGYCESD